jgi:alcohol dehydrogenase (NADP+)
MNPVDAKTVPVRQLYTGDTIPAIGMGTFGSDHAGADEVSAAVAGAIDFGYRLFDCAACYGNEAEIGKVFEAAMQAGTVRREDLFVTSKLWNDRHGRGDVLVACAQSLKDLRLDCLDLYFVHWPFPNYHAPHCSVDARNPDATPFLVDAFMATWRQMERLVDMGLTRFIGMSNMTIPKLEAVLPLCRIKPVAVEMELHPSFQQPELFAYLQAQGILPIGYCPLGSPNRPERDKTSEDVNDLELPEVVAIAKAHGVHPAIVCLKWAVQHGQVPIPFSVHERNYQSNLLAVLSDPLTAPEMAALEAADRNCRLIKGQVFLWEGAGDWRDLWDEDGTITQRAR